MQTFEAQDNDRRAGMAAYARSNRLKNNDTNNKTLKHKQL